MNTIFKIIVNIWPQGDVLFLSHQHDQVPTLALIARHQKLHGERARLNHATAKVLACINEFPESPETSLQAQSWWLQHIHPCSLRRWLYLNLFKLSKSSQGCGQQVVSPADFPREIQLGKTVADNPWGVHISMGRGFRLQKKCAEIAYPLTSLAIVPHLSRPLEFGCYSWWQPVLAELFQPTSQLPWVMTETVFIQNSTFIVLWIPNSSFIPFLLGACEESERTAMPYRSL